MLLGQTRRNSLVVTLGLIAAGAVLGQVMAVDRRWAVPVAIVMMTSIIDFESATKWLQF